jgi:hypothetical protein
MVSDAPRKEWLGHEVERMNRASDEGADAARCVTIGCACSAGFNSRRQIGHQQINLGRVDHILDDGASIALQNLNETFDVRRS